MKQMNIYTFSERPQDPKDFVDLFFQGFYDMGFHSFDVSQASYWLGRSRRYTRRKIDKFIRKGLIHL